MNKLLKIDSIMYKVSDLEEAKSFYQNMLGLKKVWEDKDRNMVGFVFDKNDAEIVIHANTDMPKFDYSYLVENVKEFCNSFKNKGGKLALEPITVRCGMYAVLFDPDGNAIPIIDLTKFDNQPKYD